MARSPDAAGKGGVRCVPVWCQEGDSERACLGLEALHVDLV